MVDTLFEFIEFIEFVSIVKSRCRIGTHYLNEVQSKANEMVLILRSWFRGRGHNSGVGLKEDAG